VSEIFSSVLVLPTDLERLAVLETQINELLAHAPALTEADIVQYNLHLAVHELCVNIIKHAYDGVTGKFMLTLSLLDMPWRIEASTCDHGRRRFDAERWAPPKLDELPVHGLGIFLIRSLMDEVSYAPDADCTRWRMVKHLELADAPGPAEARRPVAQHPPLHQSAREVKT
jgi:serine/threonine-protein kinase RsbW